MNKKSKNIAIIGCGVMGAGFARRLCAHNPIYLHDRNATKMEQLKKEGCGTPCRTLNEALEKSNIIILAIKPQGIKDFAKSIDPRALNHTIISLLSGTTILQLKKYFPAQKIIRLMPNLALICGESAIGLTTEDSFSKTELHEIDSLCKQLGKSYWISESKFNGFTSLAGSGTAFIFALIESMVEAGISMGFSANEAQEIVQQTIKGSIALLNETKKHPAELKWQVTSPGGTTIAGLRKLEEFGVRGGVINTFLAAYQHAVDLSTSS